MSAKFVIGLIGADIAVPPKLVSTEAQPRPLARKSNLL